MNLRFSPENRKKKYTSFVMFSLWFMIYLEILLSIAEMSNIKQPVNNFEEGKTPPKTLLVSRKENGKNQRPRYDKYPIL